MPPKSRSFITDSSSGVPTSVKLTRIHKVSSRRCTGRVNAPNALAWYKTRGNRGWTYTAAILFSLRALASALLLSTVTFGAAVESAEHLAKRAQPKGIDVSSIQGNVNWDTVSSKGVSFAYIKATEGTGKGDGTLVVQSFEISFQATRILPSPPSIPVPLRPV